MQGVRFSATQQRLAEQSRDTHTYTFFFFFRGVRILSGPQHGCPQMAVHLIGN